MPKMPHKPCTAQRASPRVSDVFTVTREHQDRQPLEGQVDQHYRKAQSA